MIITNINPSDVQDAYIIKDGGSLDPKCFLSPIIKELESVGIYNIRFHIIDHRNKNDDIYSILINLRFIESNKSGLDKYWDNLLPIFNKRREFIESLTVDINKLGFYPIIIRDKSNNISVLAVVLTKDEIDNKWLKLGYIIDNRDVPYDKYNDVIIYNLLDLISVYACDMIDAMDRDYRQLLTRNIELENLVNQIAIVSVSYKKLLNEKHIKQ